MNRLEQNQNKFSGVTPLRPLAISNFVREELPRYLEEIRKDPSRGEEFSDALERRLAQTNTQRQVSDLLLHASPEQQKLAMLDLVMLEAALEHSKRMKPAQLSESVDMLSRALGIPPHLTYELIIRNNPFADTRVFTRGECGATERGFYVGHEVIEQRLMKAIELVDEVIGEMRIGRGDAAQKSASNLQSVALIQRDITTSLSDHYMTIDLGAFNTFRQYLFGTRGSSIGPSGAHSANHFALRLLVFGSDVGRGDYMLETKNLYPRCDIDRLMRAQQKCEAGSSLFQLTRNLDPQDEIRKGTLAVMDASLMELHAHFAIVKRAIIGKGNVDKAGTGGQPKVLAFLQSGIDALKNVRTNFARGGENL